mmetsp:Transcript_91221/g.284272  ORF Transcript_91221/g.284272 Transcript_91221/m.284272 type:complete len:167 (-) Transcript_91221:98-598(-)
MEGFQVVTTGTNVSVTTGSVVGEVGIFTSDTGYFNVEGIKVKYMRLHFIGFDDLDVIVIAAGRLVDRSCNIQILAPGSSGYWKEAKAYEHTVSQLPVDTCRRPAPSRTRSLSAGWFGNWKEPNACENDGPFVAQCFQRNAQAFISAPFVRGGALLNAWMDASSCLR